MRFLYSCDVHGDTSKYEKLLQRAIDEKIEYIVIGGDIYPKKGGERPIIQPEFIRGYLKEYFQKLQDNDIKFIFIPGNDDLEETDDELNELCNKFTNVYNIDNKSVELEDVQFIGLSKVIDNPFANKNRILVEDESEMQHQISEQIYIEKRTKIITVDEWREYRKTKVEKFENALANLPKPDGSKKVIYVLHCPPYGIGLDVCRTGEEVGSKQIRKFLEKSNCYMSLHGHIHESPTMSGIWKSELNGTICIQPGQAEFQGPICNCVDINTDTDEIELLKI